jgi:NAD(P)-dependent dehydrogenase (short-subunit alcohol dehydrogenase family)
VTGALAGRTAVVTGAGQGVGQGIAAALALRGANVVLAARRAETGEPAAAAIRDRGGEACCIVTDVTRGDDVERCVSETVGRYGRLEIMVHNAFHGGRPHRLEEVDDALWATNSRTAVWGSYYCAPPGRAGGCCSSPHPPASRGASTFRSTRP